MKLSKTNLIFHFFCIIFLIYRAHASQQPFTFMVNPFGDAGNAGRVIDGCYERGLTLQFAEELKQTFKKNAPHVRVILTRFPGERLEPLQNANFANRLKTDLYLNIQFYFQEHDLSQVTLYYYIQHPTELWVKNLSATLEFIPYDQAHRTSLKKTQEWATLLAKELEAISHSKSFRLQGIYACPFKPLMGIQAPSITIEIGLKNKDDWQRFVEPLVFCFERLIVSIQIGTTSNE